MKRANVGGAGVSPTRWSTRAVLMVAVGVLTAVASAGCGYGHGSGRPIPAPASSTTYPQGGDSVPPLSTPGAGEQVPAPASGGIKEPEFPSPTPTGPGGLQVPPTPPATAPPTTPPESTSPALVPSS
jgi:hypothetical protein